MRLILGALCLLGVGLVGNRATEPQRAAPAHPNKSAAPLADTGDRIYLDQAASTATASKEGAPSAVASMLNVKRRLQYGDYVWDDKNVPRGPVWIRIDLNSQLLSVFRAGQEIGTSVILYGATEKETPAGVFPILAKMSSHRSSSYDAEMPYTLRLTNDGVAIHASNVRWGMATHGCIGVPLAFAQKLFNETSRGDKVLIVAGPRSA